jgi:hypothetical protein
VETFKNVCSAEYGPAAFCRLRAGFPTIYREDDRLVEEHPDGRRYEICLFGESIASVRDLPPRRRARSLLNLARRVFAARLIITGSARYTDCFTRK